MLHSLFHVHIVCHKEIIELLFPCVICSDNGMKTGVITLVQKQKDRAWEVIT